MKFSSLEISGGNTAGDGGGIRSAGANLTVYDCHITGCVAGGSGGGIYATGPNTGSVSISDSTKVHENTAGLSGGGIAVTGTSLTVSEKVEITGNNAGRGGGGLFVGMSPSVTIRGGSGIVTISNNIANDGDGGGVLITGTGVVPGGGAPRVDLQAVTISDNKAYDGANGNGWAGGIAVFGAFDVDADANTLISRNGQQGNGQQVAPPPAAPVWGVFIDPAILAGSTFWTNAVITADNYHF